MMSFRIDIKEGVVVFKQTSHGHEVVSVSRLNPEDKFNIGVGQLIAMKRNEIKIRKNDLVGMREVQNHLSKYQDVFAGTMAGKLYGNYRQHCDEMIRASLNHIKELNQDLRDLYAGTYAPLPEEVKNGDAIYVIKDGSITLGKTKDVIALGAGCVAIYNQVTKKPAADENK